jgi:hypothetical protein
MPVVAKVVIPGFSKAQYEALRDAVGWLDEPPAGGITHVAWWEGEDCHGLDVWESEEAWNRFGQDRMGPAMGKLGFNAQPEATFFPLAEAFAPQPSTILG